MTVFAQQTALLNQITKLPCFWDCWKVRSIESALIKEVLVPCGCCFWSLTFLSLCTINRCSFSWRCMIGSSVQSVLPCTPIKFLLPQHVSTQAWDHTERRNHVWQRMCLSSCLTIFFLAGPFWTLGSTPPSDKGADRPPHGSIVQAAFYLPLLLPCTLKPGFPINLQ